MAETATIAEFVTATTFDDVPEHVLEKAKTHLRDTLGVALAGSTREVGDIAVDYAMRNAPGGGATVIGQGTASPEGAALANGVQAHALEWDDTPGGPHHLSHPSPPTLPAVLAAAERDGVSGADALTGYVVGVETLSRLELASFPDHYFHGWHDTGTYGVFGAVAAAASIFGLDRETTKRALGIAASSSSGLRKNNGTMTKPYHAGHAAADGYRAAALAEAGMTADPEMIDGRLGYGEVYSPGEYDPSTLETFGDDWHFMDYGYKPFPGITFMHGAQTALQRLVVREDIEPDDVERITVHLDEQGWDTLWNESPEDPFAAIASPEFGLAVILRERDHHLDHFDADYVTAPETKAQMAKVERAVLDDDDFDMFGARVVVETTDGEEYVEEAHYSPLDVSEERLTEKFYQCAESVLDRSTAEAVDEAVSEVEAADDLSAMLAPLRSE